MDKLLDRDIRKLWRDPQNGIPRFPSEEKMIYPLLFHRTLANGLHNLEGQVGTIGGYRIYRR